MTYRRLTFWLLASFAITAAGCNAWKPAPPALPARSLELDQLIIYSDSPLPKHHRLIEEIAAQRSSLSTMLALPTSDEPIHVYLFRDARRFKAFLHAHHPDFPDRRAFFVETDIKLSVFAFWGDRVAEDLRHEVTHGYLHSIVPRLPLWLDEGLAEYFEVPHGRHGLNEQHMQLLKSAPEGAWRPDMRRLEALREAGDMKQSDYAEAWAWVHYLLETTPERRQLLQRHLQAIRKDQGYDPLSTQVDRSEKEWRGESLVDHIAELNAASPE